MVSNSPTSGILFGRLANFRADIAHLQRYYHEVIEPTQPTPYYDNGAEYEGWSITSRDGTTSDGVKRINRGGSGPRGTIPTPLCKGFMSELLVDLSRHKLFHYRARVMRLVGGEFEMKFHHDADVEKWRLHVPIETNPESYFEWRLPNGSIEKVHFPADGSAWFVRVDQTHRATNEGPASSQRIHLLMSLSKKPLPESIEQPFLIARDQT